MIQKVFVWAQSLGVLRVLRQYPVEDYGRTNKRYSRATRKCSFEQFESRRVLAAVCGVVDELLPDGRIRGWAFDPDTPNIEVNLHLYVNTLAGQSTFVGVARTTELRSDVNSVYRISGNHGYTLVIPEKFQDGTPLLDGNRRNWILYGLNSSGENDNRPIGASTPQNRGDTNCNQPFSVRSPIQIAVPQVQVLPQDYDKIKGTITDADALGQPLRYTASLLGGPVFTGETDSSGGFTLVVPPVLTIGTSSSLRMTVENKGNTGRATDSNSIRGSYDWPFTNFPTSAESSPVVKPNFPTNLGDDQVLTGAKVFVYQEWTNKVLQNRLILSASGIGDFIGPGTQFPEMQNLRPGSVYPTPNASVPAGTRIESYYIHFDPSQPTDSRQRLTYTTGTITFPNRIIGIISENEHLNASNATDQLGRPGYTYGNSGLEIRVSADEGGSLDSVRVLSDGRTLRYAFRARGLDAFRVITEPTNVVPSFVGSTLFTTEENNTNVGQVLAVDPDNGPSSLAYSVNTSTLDGRFFRISASGVLSFIAAPDYERPLDQGLDNDYDLDISASDGAAVVTNRFRVRVSNINEAPTQIVLSNNGVQENQNPESIVGVFSTVDPDASNSFAYSLVDGIGSIDNSRFRVDSMSGELKTAESFDFETRSNYSIRLRTTDQGGLTFERDFPIVVTDVNEPPTLTRPLSNIDGNVLTTFANNGAWSDPESGNVVLTASLGDIVKNANGTWSWSYLPSVRHVNQLVTITASDGNSSSSVTFTVNAQATVRNRNVYYKNSAFASTSVQAALDSSKIIAMAGATPQTLSFSNLINTNFGLNGIVLDVAGLASNNLTTADFRFRMSPTGAFDEASNPPSSWATAPSPSAIVVTPGTATSPARIALEWADNAIENRWLQVRLLANANTGLLSQQTYYIGHLQGETNGLVTASGLFQVTNADITVIKPLVGQLADVTSVVDLNKNGFVQNADITLVKVGVGIQQLRNITIPVEGSGGEGEGAMLAMTYFSPIAVGVRNEQDRLLGPTIGPRMTLFNYDVPRPVENTRDQIIQMGPEPTKRQSISDSGYSFGTVAVDAFFARLSHKQRLLELNSTLEDSLVAEPA